jgi:hypothetical protein
MIPAPSSPANSPAAFWQWFATQADRLAATPDDAALIRELDDRVHQTWPLLSWEIGPDPSGEWYLALSPNLNRKLRAPAAEAVQSAPPIPGWHFYPTRPQKAWTGKFELETSSGIVHLDWSNWRYTFVRYPDGETEMILEAPECQPLSPEDRWQAAAIVLEGLLGEEPLLQHPTTFALVPALDAELAAHTKPLHALAHDLGLVPVPVPVPLPVQDE